MLNLSEPKQIGIQASMSRPTRTGVEPNACVWARAALSPDVRALRYTRPAAKYTTIEEGETARLERARSLLLDPNARERLGLTSAP